MYINMQIPIPIINKFMSGRDLTIEEDRSLISYIENCLTRHDITEELVFHYNEDYANDIFYKYHYYIYNVSPSY